MRIEDGKPGRIPVIAVTAHVTAEGGPSVLAAGFDDVIYKPVDAPELFDKLGKHLGVHYEHRVPEAPGRGGAEPKPPLDRDDLSAVPAEWMREFSRMLRRGRPAPLLALIDQLPPECAAVARHLADLVRVHAFDKLIAVTEGVAGDRSNG